ncbi:MAG: ABC transporter permease [Solirubrobacteraceae bacterium]
MAFQVVWRLALLFASLLVASIAVFAVMNVLPGNPAAVILGEQATPAAIHTLDQQLGLDQPGIVRYFEWLGGMLSGDFGISYIQRIPVGPLLGQRLLVTLPLALYGTLISLAISIPLGIIAALNHRNWLGTLISALSMGGLSIPAFWAGLLLASLFAVKLRLFPVIGFVPWSQNPLQSIQSLTLPALALGLIQGAILVRYVRSAVIEVQGEDFLRTARANGLTFGQAIRRHGLRNAAIPVVTAAGLFVIAMLGGTILVEQVFALPGLGSLVVQAATDHDLPVIEGVVLYFTVIVIALNLLTDLSYAWLNPKVRVAS